MGLKQSSPTAELGDYAARDSGGGARGFTSPANRASFLSSGVESVGTAVRTRALSLGNFISSSINDTLSLNSSTSGNTGLHDTTPGDSDDYSSDDDDGLSPSISTASLPTRLTFYHDIKCPVCHKNLPADSVEIHLLMCLTKPQIVYNDDVLTEDKGECSICLDDLQQGDTIARLPCLCIYHKGCIDRWFEVNRSCPEHPGD